jgi:hypothetical protein
MSYRYFYFILIFVIGEIIINITFFNYLKKYFKVNQNSGEELSVKFLGLDISLFKGLLERFVLYLLIQMDGIYFSMKFNI